MRVSKVSGIAELLDDVRPGWHDEIDTDRLNMDCGKDCLMGQLYGGYTKGRIALGISAVDAPALGIVAADTGDGNLFANELLILQEDALAEIQSRRNFDIVVEGLTGPVAERESVYA